ncbi:type III polyketide synthase [Alkalihalobacillus pseudalcaliphilus]|uniref:type III polyketide synthase n=1 Tax=Alkalihalobacillus pseudalcaliphilus TaxID=79884 RepID=UPI00064DC856|nr:3-oxoacyl-[acyl-carrier-protein] synthase III C-terminal domain-containing protein [Alkalihalobacillus pseudalcaliphilus]KMK75322.1 chalcone synthase [Alkalihalobacillus pseudalcaliphilus]
MVHILSVGTYQPPHKMTQKLTMEFAEELFSESFTDIQRLLPVFQNGQIENRYFSMPMDWFEKDHSLEEKNNLYIKLGVDYSVKAILACLESNEFLKEKVEVSEIDALILVSSSGMSTPSLDARIMNQLPFSAHTKRMPLWGLGCAGGAIGMSRAMEYCLAYPEQNVLVCCVELCSLTFQRNDRTKSNLIGTSLFADGVACALVCGEHSPLVQRVNIPVWPRMLASYSTLMPDSEEIMGWDVKDSGLHVVFSRDIPHVVQNWFKPNVEEFLHQKGLEVEQVDVFVAHPGGKKVLDAYEAALGISQELTLEAREILRYNGNMSSPTVLYVLEECMKKQRHHGEVGLMAALGPGFCSELVLLNWGGIH